MSAGSFGGRRERSGERDGGSKSKRGRVGEAVRSGREGGSKSGRGRVWETAGSGREGGEWGRQWGVG